MIVAMLKRSPLDSFSVYFNAMIWMACHAGLQTARATPRPLLIQAQALATPIPVSAAPSSQLAGRCVGQSIAVRVLLDQVHLLGENELPTSKSSGASSRFELIVHAGYVQAILEHGQTYDVLLGSDHQVRHSALDMYESRSGQ